MRREHLAAFIFLSTDPHNGEYVPDHWKGRQWISGFDGSAGVAVVTMSSAALWTDSRYFIAAENQLQGTEFVLMKEKVEGTPTIAEWLGKELFSVKLKDVGIDGTTASYAYVEQLKLDLRENGGLTLRTNFDPLNRIWTDRPSIPTNPIELHDIKYAGESAQSKIDRTRRALRALHADGTIVTALDDIAWLLNLRGTDVHCNPVFVSYLLITTRGVTLFVDPRKLTPEVKSYLEDISVDVRGYGEVTKALAKYPDYSILVDEDEVNYILTTAVRCQHRIAQPQPIKSLKAVKNPVEIEGMHRAMRRDGVAMVKFLKWLLPAVESGGVTEMSVDEQLTALRAQQEHYRGLSFDTIAGYEAHGAIVHYEATADTNSSLSPKGLLLLDSGAQYLDGTTDITRTIALGPLTTEQRHIYTLVLKAHIGLALAKFPDGAAGTQIDALARIPLWREGLNYLHGTGHGVGSYLNVHEGPHQVRMEWKPTPLRVGMTITNEPGIYLEGRFGVRTENTCLVVAYKSTEMGNFLQLESLTLCPIDTTPIVKELLTAEEVEWLNNYHERVYDELSPFLSREEREWLRQHTQAI